MVLLVTDSEDYFTKVHGLQSSNLSRHPNSAEENVGEKTSAIAYRPVPDYASAYATGVQIGTLKSSESGEQFRSEEYLSGQSEAKKSRSNRVSHNANAGPYNILASSGKHENTTESDFFNLTREDEESQIEQSKKGISASAAMKISEPNAAAEEIEEMKVEKSPGALQAYEVLSIE